MLRNAFDLVVADMDFLDGSKDKRRKNEGVSEGRTGGGRQANSRVMERDRKAGLTDVRCILGWSEKQKCGVLKSNSDQKLPNGRY